MNWTEFTAIPNGTEIFNHGYSECVALANLYHERVLGGSFVPVQSAHQWWTQHWPQLSAYHRASRPVAGSIVVWDTRWGAGHGHIGVVTSVLPDGRFTTMEQNAGGGPAHRYVNRYTRGMTGVLGFLIPVHNPADLPPTPLPPRDPHPPINETGDEEEMKLWIADVKGHWRLVVPTGNGKPNAATLPAESGMGGGGAAAAGIPVISFASDAELRKIVNL